MNTQFGLLLILPCLLLAGCASSKAGDVYSRDQARHEMNVRMATIESVRAVTLEGSRSGIGTVAGGAVGGIAGHGVGGGRGQAIGAVLGTVAGAVVGTAIEQSSTTTAGVEITVKLDNGQLTAIVQEGDVKDFRPGDRVRLISTRGETRVSR